MGCTHLPLPEAPAPVDAAADVPVVGCDIYVEPKPIPGLAAPTAAVVVCGVVPDVVAAAADLRQLIYVV